MNDPLFNPEDFPGNVTSLLIHFMFEQESEVPITSFTIVADGLQLTVQVGEGKYKSALLLYYLASFTISGVGRGNFSITPEMQILVRNYFGPEICEDATMNPETKHVTVRALLSQNARVMLSEDSPMTPPVTLYLDDKACQAIIEQAWEDRANLSPSMAPPEIREAIEFIIGELDQGRLRVAEKINGAWITHQWVKKAVLLYFRLHDNRPMGDGPLHFFDKVPTKFEGWNQEQFVRGGFRVVPPATARRGVFIAKGAVLMPSYVNIGAHVGEGTMVDTWATVGSCAQIGRNVHLSGGVGIGGVLEPIQANPTIIEDNCFIGARSEIVEGVVVEENSVISMGVYIGQSTKIYDRETGEVHYGRVPAGSVVVSGNLPSADGRYSLYCAVIVKKVDAATRAKTAINELLRD